MISAFGRGMFDSVKFAESEAGDLRDSCVVGLAEASASGVGAARRAQESPRSLGLKHAAKERGL